MWFSDRSLIKIGLNLTVNLPKIVLKKAENGCARLHIRMRIRCENKCMKAYFPVFVFISDKNISGLTVTLFHSFSRSSCHKAFNVW